MLREGYLGIHPLKVATSEFLSCPTLAHKLHSGEIKLREKGGDQEDTRGMEEWE